MESVIVLVPLLCLTLIVSATATIDEWPKPWEVSNEEMLMETGHHYHDRFTFKDSKIWKCVLKNGSGAAISISYPGGPNNSPLPPPTPKMSPPPPTPSLPKTPKMSPPPPTPSPPKTPKKSPPPPTPSPLPPKTPKKSPPPPTPSPPPPKTPKQSPPPHTPSPPPQKTPKKSFPPPTPSPPPPKTLKKSPTPKPSPPPPTPSLSHPPTPKKSLPPSTLSPPPPKTPKESPQPPKESTPVPGPPTEPTRPKPSTHYQYPRGQWGQWEHFASCVTRMLPSAICKQQMELSYFTRRFLVSDYCCNLIVNMSHECTDTVLGFFDDPFFVPLIRNTCYTKC